MEGCGQSSARLRSGSSNSYGSLIKQVLGHGVSVGEAQMRAHGQVQVASVHNVEAELITNILLWVPCHNYIIKEPKTIF